MKKISDKKLLQCCSVRGCDKPHKALGYCQGHYVQIRKHGKIVNTQLSIKSPKRNNLPQIIKCKGCGKEFNRGKVANRIFCSKECVYKNKQKTGFFRNCLICGNSFYITSKRQKNAKYCSTDCYSESQKKPVYTILCAYCGKEHQRGESYIKWQKIRGVKNNFCSYSCATNFNANRGIKNKNWNGGISRAYKYGYHSVEYKQWHNDVFERDNFTCQICNTRGTYLHAHHIKGFSKYPDLRFTVSNGITLCKKCHMEVHSNKCKSESGLKKQLNVLAMEDRGKIKKNLLLTKNCLNCGEVQL